MELQVSLTCGQRANGSSESEQVIKDTIIIIKPESDKGKELINDPIEIVTALEQSKYGKLKIDDIRTNKRKGLLVAYVKQQTLVTIEELVKVKKLDK